MGCILSSGRKVINAEIMWICSFRLPDFKSLYRKRTIPPWSCAHLAHSRFRYSSKTSLGGRRR
jgi:hypothetical protein